MGGDAWGDHLQCPGNTIVNQREAIIARAKAIADAELSSEPGHPDLLTKAAQIAAASSKLGKRPRPNLSTTAGRKRAPSSATKTKGRKVQGRSKRSPKEERPQVG